MVLAIVLGFLVGSVLATPCLAETASSSPRAALVGVGGRQGVLGFTAVVSFTVSGMSVGFTIGASTTSSSAEPQICAVPAIWPAAVPWAGRAARWSGLLLDFLCRA